MYVASTHKYYKIIIGLKDMIFKEEQKHFARCKKINDLIASILDEDCKLCINYNEHGLCNKGLSACMKNTTHSQFALNLKKIKV